jgi:hypothetical protein
MKNLDCSIVELNLFDYLENKLQPNIRNAFEAHISVCPSCNKLLIGIQSIDVIIEKARMAEPDPFASTRIIQRIENELTKHENKRVRALRPILVTFTIICAIAMGFAIGKSRFDRVSGYADNQNQIENLKTELFIHDFIDENRTILINK